MKKSLFLIFGLFVLLAYSCSNDAKPKDLSGKLNEVCKADASCDAGLACKENKCVTKESACKFVTCLNHGSCIVEDSKAVCNCDTGYKRENDIKCVVSDVCNGITCSGHGTCENINGDPKCNCETGYSQDGTGELCLKSLDPCANINCGGTERGTCQSNDGLLECICKSGYHVQDLNCISDSNPCDGITCSGHGTCGVDGSSVECTCDSGFLASGLECIDETTNPCQNQTCSDHGTCEVHSNEATCICDTGYNPGENLTCLGSGNQTDVCKDVTCADETGTSHGLCHEDTDGNPVCLCDAGYIRANYMCIEDMGSPCYGKTCSEHGTCKIDDVDDTKAFCDCEEGFYPGTGLTCIDISTICNGIDCSGHGTCIANSDGSPTCNCDATYVAVGTECLENPCEPNPCENIANTNTESTCTANSDNTYSCVCSGLCDDGNDANNPQDSSYYWDQSSLSCLCGATCENDNMHPENGVCVCDLGYQPDGEFCILSGSACDSNPCAGTQNTNCVLDNQTEAGYVCMCKDGYSEDQFNNCVVSVCVSSPCEDNVDDPNKTKCVADGNTFKCKCADGYIDNNGTCESESNSACDSNPCTGQPNSTGECIPGPSAVPDLYMCTCNAGYTWDYMNTNSCVACDECVGLANATGNCEMGFDGSQMCECETDYEYIVNDQGVGSCELTNMP